MLDLDLSAGRRGAHIRKETGAMSHDLIAELTGYREELTAAKSRGADARATAVEAEVDRVVELINEEVKQLRAKADEHDEAGEDLTAATLRIEARRLARATSSEQETAEQNMPQETATPGKGKRPATR